MSTVAKDLRQDAVARLVEIAASSPAFTDRLARIDMGLLASRPASIKVVQRWALRACIGDELAMAEVNELLPIALGNATAMLDCLLGAGMPAAHREQFTLSDVETAFTQAWGSGDVVD